MLVYIKRSMQHVDTPVLISHKHGQSSCTFLATAIDDRNYAWCPQLHDCPQFSAQCYINLIIMHSLFSVHRARVHTCGARS